MPDDILALTTWRKKTIWIPVEDHFIYACYFISYRNKVWKKFRDDLNSKATHDHILWAIINNSVNMNIISSFVNINRVTEREIPLD